MSIAMQNVGGVPYQTTPALAAKDAEIARLRAEVEKVRGYEVAPLEAKVAELRAEVDGLRTALEVIAVGDSRTPHIDAAQALLRSGYWIDEIDAAMGASA